MDRVNFFNPIKSRYLKPCETEFNKNDVSPFVLVLYGATGDLSRKKLIPSLLGLFKNKYLPENFKIIATGRKKLTDVQFNELIGASDTQLWNDFLSHFQYISAEFNEIEDSLIFFEKIKKERKILGNEIPTIFYLAIPPHSMENIITSIGSVESGLVNKHHRIIIEKPFGNDKNSAYLLNGLLHKYFKEEQIFRIDHYLGKETVQNILFFRFSNLIFEPIWNRNYINNIQITVSESIGIENRGRFYERVGVIRDVVQNHIMQLIALITMESPAGFEADLIRDEKVKIFRSIKIYDEEEIGKYTLCGQYGGNDSVNSYREEKYVSSDSQSPTFFSGVFFIDNWRWAGVPIFVRTGKRLKKRETKIIINFTLPPLHLIGRNCDILNQNKVVFHIQPKEETSILMNVKKPGSENMHCPVKMVFNYEDSFKVPRIPDYQRLLLDCFYGDLMLFARADGINLMWQIVDPIIEYWSKSSENLDFPNYEPGSWGPEESDKIPQIFSSNWD